jgi:uncharacterized damage-inducible protein DinB
MDLIDYIQGLYQYDKWANEQVLQAASRLTEGQIYQQQGHSWGSVHGILLHMMNAEWIWLRRCLGESPGSFYSELDFPTLTALRKYWAEIDAEMNTFIIGQCQQSIISEVVYTNTLGNTYQLLRWQILVHVANHNTHHRGELAAMFSAMDISHQEDDWLHYFLEQSGQR